MFETLSIDQHSNLMEWLKTQAERYKCQWLLAHSLDCVIWGKFEQSKLLLGCDATKLNFETLQQCRIFGLEAEVLLWHNGSSWQATVIKDPIDPTDPAESDKYIDEWQMLWGTAGEPSTELWIDGEKMSWDADGEPATTFDRFTTLTDGIQGMQHTLPLVFEPQERYFGPIVVKSNEAIQQPNHRPARLLVRHILDFDPNTKAAYIRASRLVELSAKEIEHGNRS